MSTTGGSRSWRTAALGPRDLTGDSPYPARRRRSVAPGKLTERRLSRLAGGLRNAPRRLTNVVGTSRAQQDLQDPSIDGFRRMRTSIRCLTGRHAITHRKVNKEMAMAAPPAFPLDSPASGPPRAKLSNRATSAVAITMAPQSRSARRAIKTDSSFLDASSTLPSASTRRRRKRRIPITKNTAAAHMSATPT
jgi:hypothetical protein